MSYPLHPGPSNSAKRSETPSTSNPPKTARLPFRNLPFGYLPFRYLPFRYLPSGYLPFG
jgi:hypothetical protein